MGARHMPHELLKALGKGVTRKRIDQQKALRLLREIWALPIRVLDIPVDEKLLDLALRHNLAIYDASYLSLALAQGMPIATGDAKLQAAARAVGVGILQP